MSSELNYLNLDLPNKVNQIPKSSKPLKTLGSVNMDSNNNDNIGDNVLTSLNIKGENNVSGM